MREFDFSTIRPIGDRVLIRRIVEEKSPGGLILVQNVDERASFRAEVLAIGPGALNKHGNRVEIEVKVGDVVLMPVMGPATKGRYRPISDAAVKDAEHVFSVPAELILAVLEPTNNSEGVSP